MDIEGIIFKMGLTTRTQNIVVGLDGTAEQVLGGELQSDIGLIYGWNIYCDTVTPKGDPLITTTDATNLYLTLKIGAQDRVEVIRLDDMLFVYAGSPVVGGKKYLTLTVPYWAFSLDKSNIQNPTLIGLGITPPPTVWINIRYLSMDDYQHAISMGCDFGIASRATAVAVKQVVTADTENSGQSVPNVANPASLGEKTPM